MMEQRLFHEAQTAGPRPDRATAYRLMRQTLIDDPTNVIAWLEMSQLVDDLQHRRECLERALALDPSSQVVRDAFERLPHPAHTPAPPSHSAGSGRLGARLVSQGVLSSAQIDEALWEQRQRHRRGEDVRLGDILLQRGWLRPRLLARTLVAQQQDGLSDDSAPAQKRIGDYLLREGLISARQLENALEAQMRLRLKGRPVHLGLILVRQGAISLDMLRQMLIRQEEDAIKPC